MDWKKCSYCNRTLSFNEFRKYSGLRGSKKGVQAFRSICRDCEKINDSIRGFKKQIIIINEYFKGKCQSCNKDLSWLPSLNFHHLNPEIKDIPWTQLKKFTLKKIKSKVFTEQAMILCSNCHINIHSTFFNKYKDLILMKELFLYSPEEIDVIINFYINSSQISSPKIKAKEKFHLKRWIRKRYIIEQFFNNGCIGCEQIDINKNLSCLSFHHRDPDKKRHKFEEISNLKIEDILKIIEEEDIVCLCSNCHSLIHTRYFYDNLKVIFKGDLHFFAKKALKNYEDIENNVKNFKYMKIEGIKDPFKKEINYGEGWKSYLIAIYEIIMLKNLNTFTSKEVAEKLEISQKGVNNYLHKMVDKKLIELIDSITSIRQGHLIYGKTPNKYKMTQYGITTVKKLF